MCRIHFPFSKKKNSIFIVKYNIDDRVINWPPVSQAAYEEIALRYHYDIKEKVMKHKIPDDFIITLDQTPSKLLNVGKNTMAKTNSKRVALRDSDEKRAITITIAATLTGEILPFQMIYDGKTARSRPDPALLPDGFLLCYMELLISTSRKRKLKF